jgi:amidase
MVSFLDDVSAENSALVNILLDLGAVLYVKTNVPQTMMVQYLLNTFSNNPRAPVLILC